MKIILHADDFGFDSDSCEATINAFENGLLKSASIMATCSAADLAIEYAREHPEYSFGVHLTFVDGLKPAASGHSEMPLTLIDINGNFLESNIIRRRALLLKLNSDEIFHEMLSQIEIIESAGIPLSHIDSHGHLHKFPSFLMALEKLQKHRPELKVRRVQNIFLKAPSIVAPSNIINRCFDYVIKKRYRSTDYFYMPANNFDTKWGTVILGIIKKLPSSSTLEIGVHPGYKEEWRKNELDDLSNFVSMIDREVDCQLITWHDL